MSDTGIYANQQGVVYDVAVSMTVAVCYSCHMPFQMPTAFRRRALADHSISFYCPAGHSQHFVGKTEADRLKDQLRWTRESETFYREQAATERRRAAAQRGQVTRIRNLVAKGICPVQGCRRNFTNVRDHMTTEHPDFHGHEES